MKISASLPNHGVILETILEGFTVAAEHVIAAGAAPPFPDSAGVRFEAESGTEEWRLPHQVMEQGAGDCEDLAIWEAAGLRVTGQDPLARVVLINTAPGAVHAIVVRSDGRRSDPSARLKLMAARRQSSLGAPPRRKGTTKEGTRRQREPGETTPTTREWVRNSKGDLMKPWRFFTPEQQAAAVRVQEGIAPAGRSRGEPADPYIDPYAPIYPNGYPYGQPDMYGQGYGQPYPYGYGYADQGYGYGYPQATQWDGGYGGGFYSQQYDVPPLTYADLYDVDIDDYADADEDVYE